MIHHIIFPTQLGATIRPEIYGNFSEHLGRCIYEGFFVGKNSPIPNVAGMRKDVVDAMKNIRLPVLRWPGGCFADEYHWQQGIGPQEKRKRMVNTNWGGVVEDNSFGTHEFMELCRQIGCKPYINGNVGSGSVQEMAEWIEYMTAGGDSTMALQRAENGHADPWSVDYFGVGNENWGCGGNMRPEYYADLYRRYQSYVKQYTDKKIYKIACGAGNDYLRPNLHWTEVLMREAAFCMDGLSLHYYTVPTGDWQHKGSATDFTTEEYYETLHRTLYMEELLQQHIAIMDKYDPEKRIGLIVDEWGTWYDVEPGTNPGFLYQQSSMRDALVAGINLNLFNKHADRVHMANIAQTINVLQAVCLTDGDQMVLTPTYHVFDLYKPHHGATLLASALNAPEENGVPTLHESASIKDGAITFTVCNLSADKPQQVRTTLPGASLSLSEARILTDDIHAHNDFETGSPVAIQSFDGITVTHENGDTILTYTLPACAVAAITLK